MNRHPAGSEPARPARPPGAGELHSHQDFFWHAVTGCGPFPAGTPLLQGSTPLPPERGLRLYRAMYRQRIGEILRATFPTVEQHLGVPDFRRLALSYLDRQPSRDPRLEFVGQDFPAFLRAQGHVPWQREAETADLDWARWAAPLAPDPEGVLRHDQLRQDHFVKSRLRLIPSLHCVKLGQDVCAVWSDSGILYERSLAAEESAALRRALTGALLPEICECFAALQQPVQRAFQVLSAWLTRSWIVRLEPAGEEDE